MTAAELDEATAVLRAQAADAFAKRVHQNLSTVDEWATYWAGVQYGALAVMEPLYRHVVGVQP